MEPEIPSVGAHGPPSAVGIVSAPDLSVEGELELQMRWPSERLDDALAELVRDGLAHHRDGFAWASHSAIRTRELLA